MIPNATITMCHLSQLKKTEAHGPISKFTNRPAKITVPGAYKNDDDSALTDRCIWPFLSFVFRSQRSQVFSRRVPRTCSTCGPHTLRSCHADAVRRSSTRMIAIAFMEPRCTILRRLTVFLAEKKENCLTCSSSEFATLFLLRATSIFS